MKILKELVGSNLSNTEYLIDTDIQNSNNKFKKTKSNYHKAKFFKIKELFTVKLLILIFQYRLIIIIIILLYIKKKRMFFYQKVFLILFHQITLIIKYGIHVRYRI